MARRYIADMRIAATDRAPAEHRPPTRGLTVNDVHSRLNPTAVARIVTPESIHDIQDAVARAQADRLPVAIAAGRHAMGGQQFRRRGVLLDMCAMTRVDALDTDAGLVTVGAGLDWVRLVNHLLWAGAGEPQPWSIIQKQTGADHMSIGGALSANIHGRGLRLRPFVADIASFDLVRGDGSVTTCSRTHNADLFALAIGGYGLLGVVARVTLRLARRYKLERAVAIVSVDDLPRLFEDRLAQGFDFGDFQFATDASSSGFLRVGVLSCYRRASADRAVTADCRSLDIRDWRRLLYLAHTDKSLAFAEYARHYMATDGQIYWSDTHQLSAYIDGYHEAVDRQVGASVRGSETITELFVRRADLPAFMSAVRNEARRHDVDVIYGTVRLIEAECETVLSWARDAWACVVINVHVDHTAAGIAKAQQDMRRLIDIAADFGGSYYLTYHRWATRIQAERCHPRLGEFLNRKLEVRPRARVLQRLVHPSRPAAGHPKHGVRVMIRITAIAIVALTLLPGRIVSAQIVSAGETDVRARSVTMHELVLQDGSRLYGEIVSQDETELRFRTHGGTLVTIARTQILSIRPVRGVLAEGEFLPADPNVTRLFFGPTGRSLKRGQAYLGVYEFLLPFVQVGLTDRFSIGGGTPLVFGAGESDRPFWITPKMQLVNRGATQIAVGLFHGFSGEGDYGGIAYLVGTRGTESSSVTAGIGVGYSGSGAGAGVVMIGGESQARRNMKFITENYFWQGGHAVVSGGVRFFGERLSADLALASPVTEGFFVGPLVNFVYIF